MVSSLSVIGLGKLGAPMAVCFAEECVGRSGVVVLATPGPEFRDLPASAWARPAHVALRIVIDCRRALDHLKGVDGIRYVRLGFGGAAERRKELTSRAR
jgi:hypothetical protein